MLAEPITGKTLVARGAGLAILMSTFIHLAGDPDHMKHAVLTASGLICMSLAATQAHAQPAVIYDMGGKGLAGGGLR